MNKLNTTSVPSATPTPKSVPPSREALIAGDITSAKNLIKNPKVLSKMLEREALIEQATVEQENLRKEQEKIALAQSEWHDQYVHELIKETDDDTLPVKSLEDFVADSTIDMPKPIDTTPFKPKHVTAVRSTRRDREGHYVAEKTELQRSPLVVDDASYADIGKSFGKDNFYDSMTPDGNLSRLHKSNNVPTLAKDPLLTIENSIPDYDPELLVKQGRTFTDINKDLMQQQMNVVALYSIKDAKPFYYVSSAEARMAIEYINEARTYKKDLHKFRQETYDIVNTYINDTQMANVQDSMSFGAPRAYKELFNRDFIDDIVKDDMETGTPYIAPNAYSSLTTIRKIESRALYPMSILNKTINSMLIQVTLTKDLLNTPFITLIELHENITNTFGDISHIIAGQEFMDFINVEIYDQNIRINKANQNLKGIVANYSGRHGQKSVSFRPTIQGSFQILSRNPSRGTQTMFHYHVIK